MDRLGEQLVSRMEREKRWLLLPLPLALGLNRTPFGSKKQQEAERCTNRNDSNIKEEKSDSGQCMVTIATKTTSQCDFWESHGDC